MRNVFRQIGIVALGLFGLVFLSAGHVQAAQSVSSQQNSNVTVETSGQASVQVSASSNSSSSGSNSNDSSNKSGGSSATITNQSPSTSDATSKSDQAATNQTDNQNPKATLSQTDSLPPASDNQSSAVANLNSDKPAVSTNDVSTTTLVNPEGKHIIVKQLVPVSHGTSIEEHQVPASSASDQPTKAPTTPALPQGAFMLSNGAVMPTSVTKGFGPGLNPILPAFGLAILLFVALIIGLARVYVASGFLAELTKTRHARAPRGSDSNSFIFAFLQSGFKVSHRLMPNPLFVTSHLAGGRL